ncbi:MAG: FkbM family methyltransferase [Methylovirgula sp.]
MECLSGVDFVYFIGIENDEFRDYAPRLIPYFPRIDGLVSAAKDPGLLARGEKVLGRPVEIVHPLKVIQRARKGRVLLVDFTADLVSNLMVKSLLSENVVRRDYIRAIREADLGHTYVLMRDEQAYLREHRSEFAKLAERLSDDFSRAVLVARMKAYETLDRSELLAIRLPSNLEYFNPGGSPHSISLGENETFVDVGGAYGDSVFRFVEFTHGKYNKIYSFEPDKRNFQKLDLLRTFIPNLETFNCFLGGSVGEVDFFENPVNSFGSNAFNAAQYPELTKKIPMMRLDDIVENATILKMDVEGAETQVIGGATKLIAQKAPAMAVTCYHFPQDPLEIYDAVMSLHSYKVCKLRHFSGNLNDMSFVFSDRA